MLNFAKKLFSRLPFRWKAIVFIASVEGLFNIMFAIIVVGVMQNNLEEQFFKRAQITAQLFATTTENAVLATDIASLESFVDEVMNNEGLLYARVMDSTSTLAERAQTPELLKRPFRADTNLSAVHDNIFDTFALIKVDGDVYGRVELGLTTELLGTTITLIQLKVIMIGLGEIMISAIVSFLLGSFLVRRLVDLQEGSREIAGQNFGYQIYDEGHDELAQTASSFNKMSREVAHLIEELRLSNASLELAHSHLESVFDTSLSAMFVLDRHGHIETANNSAVSMFGYAKNLLLDKKFTDFLSEDCIAEYEAQFHNLRNAGEPLFLLKNEEIYGRRWDGEKFPIWLAMNVLQGEDGNKIVCDIVDLSDVRDAIVKASEAQSRSRAVLRSAMDAVVMAEAIDGVEDTIIGWNDQAENIFGWSLEEVQGKSLSSVIIPPVRQNEFRDYFVHDLPVGKTSIIEKRIELEGLRKDGDEFPCEVSISASSLPNGEQFFAVFIRDITQEKEAKEAITASETRLRSIIDNAVDGIVVISENGTIETFSPAAERIFGYEAEEVIGLNVSNLMPEQYAKDHDDHMHRYLETGLAHIIGTNREVEGKHRDGHIFPLELAVGVSNVSGRRFFTGILRDITDRKKAETKLREAQIEAEVATKAKSAFLANMSHEIRTPMNGVMGMVDVLGQSDLGDDEREMVGAIKESGKALLTIINDILDFSKIESGKLEIVSEPISVEDNMIQVCDFLELQARARDVHLTVFTDPNIPALLEGDGVRLKQILNNLISNAVKFSSGLDRSGMVFISGRLQEVNADCAWVEFVAQDNGIGMEQETLTRLFQPFEQADASTTKLFGGTGLGLVIVRNLVDLMGGTIDVQSQPNEGTVFTVRLPFKIVSEKQQKEGLRLDGAHCIVVGEDRVLADGLQAYLRYAGATVRSVQNLEDCRGPLGDCGDLPNDVCFVVLNEDAAQVAEHLAKNLGQVDKDKQIPTLEISYLAIERGQRRRVRHISSNVLQIDRNVLTYKRFIHAVAVALGYAQEESSQEGRAHKYEYVPVDRDAALEKGLLVLVAEDNRINQQVIQKQLRLLGLEADIAIDGEVAFSKWTSGTYAMLLTDLHMPHMDGYALTESIRKHETENGLKPIPIIALTANALKGEEQKCLQHGMNGYLSKPIDLDELDRKLTTYLPPREMASATDKAPVEEPMPVAETSSASREDAVDPSVLMALVGNDEDMVRSLLQDFIPDTKQFVTDLDLAFEQRNACQIGEIAHALKSSARTIGANRLADIYLKLEQAGKSEDWQTIDLLYPTLGDSLDEVRQYLAQLP